MAPQQSPEEPIQLEIVSCKSILDIHIVRLRVSISSAVRAQLREAVVAIPLQLTWHGETDEFNMPAQGAFEGQMDFRIPVPEVGTLTAQFTLPNGTILKATGCIPPVEEYRTDFADRVAHGDPLEDGDHFRIPEGTYNIDKHLIIKRGAILQADPGVQLLFAPGVGIYSEGTLLFKGTSDKLIYLNAQDPRKRWMGTILNRPHAAFSVFENCGFQDGEGTPILHREGHLLADPTKKWIKRGGGLLVMNMANAKQPVRLNRVTFRNGHADQGGGLAVYNSAVALSETYFIKNISTRSGGGLHVEHGTVNMTAPVAFHDNHSGLTGGAFAFTHGSEFEGTPPTFENNTAERRGQDGFVLASDVDTASWKADVLNVKQ